MNTDKLIRQLKREVKAHPQKAAFLGLVFVVAVWFWTPLVVGWIAPDKPGAQSVEAPPGVVPPPVAQDATTSDGKPTEANEPAEGPPWEKLVEWMENDTRMHVPDRLPTDREPFRPLQPEVKKIAETEEAATSPREETPAELGVEVSSTIIGPRRRVALINGKAYRQGQQITMVKDGRTLVFTLAEVQHRQIVLQRDGKRFEVPLPERVAGNQTLPASDP